MKTQWLKPHLKRWGFYTLVLLLCLVASSAFATPKKELSEKMGSILDTLMTESSWKDFLNNNKNLFPEINESSPTSVIVVKNDVEAKGDMFSVGTSYRQIFMKATPERVKTLLSRPDLFETIYELDKETAPSSNLQSGDKLPETFIATIYKRLPSILPDQDYSLSYTTKVNGSIWFQRVTQVEDKTDFALRETLLAVEPYKSGTVFREIGKLYPLQWVIRAIGPQLRSITKSELEKLSRGMICIAESNEPLSKELAAKCAKKKN